MTDPADKPPERGIRCPRCGCTDLRVYRTRATVGRITRTRICRHCTRKFSTTEKAAFVPDINPALVAARELLERFPQHVIVWEVGHPVAPNGYLYDARKIRCKTVDWKTMHSMQAAGLLEFIGQPEQSGISERTYYHSSAYRVTPALPLLDGIPHGR